VRPPGPAPMMASFGCGDIVLNVRCEEIVW
jgi:hypothetical protein